MAAIGGAIVGPVAILLVYLIGYSAKLIFAVIAEKHYDKRAGTLTGVSQLIASRPPNTLSSSRFWLQAA